MPGGDFYNRAYNTALIAHILGSNKIALCFVAHAIWKIKTSLYMGDFSEAFVLMANLLGSQDPELLAIISLSLKISLSATLLAALLGLPLGAAVAVFRF